MIKPMECIPASPALSLPVLSPTENIHTATPSLTQKIQGTGFIIPDPLKARQGASVLRVRYSKVSSSVLKYSRGQTERFNISLQQLVIPCSSIQTHDYVHSITPGRIIST